MKFFTKLQLLLFTLILHFSFLSAQEQNLLQLSNSELFPLPTDEASELEPTNIVSNNGDQDLLVLTNKIFNFGFMDCGEEVATEFLYYNTGKVPLIIDLRQSGYLELEWDRLLEPGDTGVIKAKFTTRGRRIGLLSAHIDVLSKNTVSNNKQSQRLYIDGYLKESSRIRLGKENYTMDTIVIGNTYNLSFEVINESEEEVIIHKFYCWENCLYNIELPIKLNPKEQQIISTSFSLKNYKEGEFSVPILITTSAMIDEYEFKVTGYAKKSAVEIP